MTRAAIRKVENTWVEKACEEAARRRISKKQFLAEALRPGLGVDSEPERRSNLDKFAGDSDFVPGWDDSLEKDLKQVDKNLWNRSWCWI